MPIPVVFNQEFMSQIRTAKAKGWIEEIDAFHSSRKDHKIVEKMRRDATLEHLFQIRCSKIIRHEWTTDNEELDLEMHTWRKVKQMMYQVEKDALMTGRGIQFVDFKKRKFRQVDHSRSYKAMGDGSNSKSWKWYIQDDMFENDNVNSKFILHIVDDIERSMGFGSGYQDALYYLYYFKTELLSYALRYFRRFGLPTIVFKYDLQAIEGHDDLATVVQNYMKKLAGKDGNDIVGIDNRNELEFLEPRENAGRDFNDMLEWIDRQMRKLILGTSLATDVSESGSFSLGKKQMENLDDIIVYDMELLAETLRTDWALPMWILMGSKGKKPTFRFLKPDKAMTPEEVNANTMRLRTAREMGLDIVKSEAYSLLGLKDPKEHQGEEVLKPDEMLPMGGASQQVKKLPEDNGKAVANDLEKNNLQNEAMKGDKPPKANSFSNEANKK